MLRNLGLPSHLHAFISRALMAGIPEAVVHERVSHVDRDILRLYTHIASTESQAAMRRFVGESEGRPVNEAGESGCGEDPKADSAQLQHKSQEVKDDSSAS